jgi:glycosyltransferase involved in cell wall biosynthesis
VQPSESEGLSIALLEAMSYGQACLVSDIEANKEALADTGYIFEDKNVSDLRSKLEYILANPDQLKIAGAKALARVKKEYNWNDIADQVLGVYKSVIKVK